MGLNSDYEINQLQLNTIKTIKNNIGVDILQNESIAGALSVYERLPAFHVGGNFNIDRGERYVTIYSLDDDKVFPDAFINIDITDGQKNLYNMHCKFVNNKKYILPSSENDLEQFSQIHISIFDSLKQEQKVQNKDDTVYQKIYEETFHLIRSFNFGLSVGGGRSKIVRNRFLNDPKDKIDVYDHIDNISNKKNKDFFDLEYDYKMQLSGTKEKFLCARYFSNDGSGRKQFHDFIREILATAKDVTVIDAYFDNSALDDFVACSNSSFNLTIITTDPESKDYKRENADNFLANIYKSLPECKIYFTDKIHDRYLYIQDKTGEKLYSLSNSWNGLVNNYSLYIQEVPLEISLRIYEEIQHYISDKNLQKNRAIIEKKHGKILEIKKNIP